MMETKLNIAEIFLIAGTRVALGAGIGLLLGGRLSRDSRKAAGIALTVVGAMTTVPLVMNILGKRSQGQVDLRAA